MRNTRTGTVILAGSCLLLVTCLSSQRVVRGQTQAEMNQESVNGATNADKQLNTVYRRLFRGADPTTQQKLKTAEKAWIVYRDAEANYEASRDGEGGTMYQGLYESAREELTRQRIKQLKELEKQ